MGSTGEMLLLNAAREQRRCGQPFSVTRAKVRQLGNNFGKTSTTLGRAWCLPEGYMLISHRIFNQSSYRCGEGQETFLKGPDVF